MATGYEVAMYRHVEQIKNSQSQQVVALNRIAEALEALVQNSMKSEKSEQ